MRGVECSSRDSGFPNRPDCLVGSAATIETTHERLAELKEE